MRLEDHTAIAIQTAVFWIVTPCILIEICRGLLDLDASIFGLKELVLVCKNETYA